MRSFRVQANKVSALIARYVVKTGEQETPLEEIEKKRKVITSGKE